MQTSSAGVNPGQNAGGVTPTAGDRSNSQIEEAQKEAAKATAVGLREAEPKDVTTSKQTEKLGALNEEAAAVKIQKIVRGNQARLQTTRMRTQDFVSKQIQPLIDTAENNIPADTADHSSTGKEGKERLKLIDRPGSTANLVKVMAEIIVEAKMEYSKMPEEERTESTMAHLIATGIETKHPGIDKDGKTIGKITRDKHSLVNQYAQVNAKLILKGVSIQQMSEISINHENGKFKLLQTQLLEKCAQDPSILKDCLDELGITEDLPKDQLLTLIQNKLETPNAHDTVAKLQAKYGIPPELSIFARTFFAGGTLPDAERDKLDAQQRTQYEESVKILDHETRDLVEQRMAVDDMAGHQGSDVPFIKSVLGLGNTGIVFAMVPKYTIDVYKILAKATREAAAKGEQLDFPTFFKDKIVNDGELTEGNLYKELFDEEELEEGNKLGSFIDEKLEELGLTEIREGALYTNKQVIALLSQQAEVLSLSNVIPEERETSPRQDRIIALMTAIKENEVMDQVGELFDCGLGIYNPSKMATISTRGDAWISGIIGMAKLAKGFKNLQEQGLLEPMKELSELLQGNKDPQYESLCKQAIAQKLQSLGCSQDRAEELTSLGGVFFDNADLTTGAWVQPLESAQLGCRVVRNGNGDVLSDSVQQLTGTTADEIEKFSQGGIINYAAIAIKMLHPTLPDMGEPGLDQITTEEEREKLQGRFDKFDTVMAALTMEEEVVEPTADIDLRPLYELKALNAQLKQPDADKEALLEQKQRLITAISPPPNIGNPTPLN